jgi:broad specificity phosphatase PhoE
MLSKIFLIRHGETAWSRSGQHTSRTDLALTPNGEAVARQLATRLAGKPFAHVFVSPRLRARQTCELAGLGAVAQVEPRLSEWDYGDYEGLTSPAIHKERPDWTIYRDGCPNGESPGQIAARADSLIADLRKLTGDVVVFSHGHFLRILGIRWVAQPVLEARHFGLDTASISILGYEHDRLDMPIISQWNAV